MNPDCPESQHIYRYWVELRDLRDDSVRNLPLTALRLVHFARKRGEPPQPDEQRLRLQDDASVIEAKDLDELAATLRSRYPDATHERRLHWERDFDAEQRYAEALDSLIDSLVHSAVRDALHEQDGAHPAGCRSDERVASNLHPSAGAGQGMPPLAIAPHSTQISISMGGSTPVEPR